MTGQTGLKQWMKPGASWQTLCRSHWSPIRKTVCCSGTAKEHQPLGILGKLHTALGPGTVQRVIRRTAGAGVAAGARSEGPRGALAAGREADAWLERAGRAFTVAS